GRDAVGAVRTAPAGAADPAVPPDRDADRARDRRAGAGVPRQGSAAPAAGRRGRARDAVALPGSRPLGQRARAPLVGTPPGGAHGPATSLRLACCCELTRAKAGCLPALPPSPSAAFPLVCRVDRARRPGMREKSRLDRTLSVFADVRAGEGMTAVLMLVNIFLLLVCYSVIKTVREPLVLLGGGAEVRSYASAGPALLLVAFVPAYSWFASRIDRARLLVGVTLFFVACIELFASALAAGVPYIGVAFFIWVGIFNISLVAQFWSFAND